MRSEDSIKAIEVFAGSALAVGFVKSLMDDAGIQSYLKDEIIGCYTSWISDAGGAGAVKLIVSSMDYEAAREVVENYKRNVKKE